MKKIFTLVAVILFAATSWAQNADYLLKKDFQTEKKKISDGIDVAKKAGSDAKKIAARQLTLLDSLGKNLSADEKQLMQTNDSLQKTAARFNALEESVGNRSMSTRNFLMIAVIVFAVLYLLLLFLVFYLKSKTEQKIRELSEENMRLGESVKQEFVLMREDLKKAADALSLNLHEYSANFAAKIEQGEEKQKNLAIETEQRFKELSSHLVTEKTEHKSLHDKIESEVKGLKTLHVKDVEEIRAKL